ncbi:homoprotocatechuate degradation operon regulator, HpaR [Hartmannibacter diazotrophicus]|uniref:Homoprotocatechuate degradation operon regulator, HpaR n=1 Tax=Hartmannibacter diazotrophicus TaxID=1482074 RepID=A0A2C9DB51_9HYPH|nr:MarR family winged helix-turn-helix transcriptional regulator [Hartmannibacter diazotrophicus]SON57486.1 homoprotocatechuate degradation operon regulator, HpaR [Hartmannibacter diazotrophicus]
MEDSVDKPAAGAETPDIATISESMVRMRMLTGRRIITRLAMDQLGIPLELTHADVIKTVKWIAKDGEVTVGAIAEMMRIDPSRSSRLVSELVERGMLRRAASQSDARRTVVELTEKAGDYFEAAERAKYDVIRAITADWSPEDIALFARLFERFITEYENVARARGK